MIQVCMQCEEEWSKKTFSSLHLAPGEKSSDTHNFFIFSQYVCTGQTFREGKLQKLWVSGRGKANELFKPKMFLKGSPHSPLCTRMLSWRSIICKSSLSNVNPLSNSIHSLSPKQSFSFFPRLISRLNNKTNCKFLFSSMFFELKQDFTSCETFFRRCISITANFLPSVVKRVLKINCSWDKRDSTYNHKAFGRKRKRKFLLVFMPHSLIIWSIKERDILIMSRYAFPVRVKLRSKLFLMLKRRL